jgi:hypothetical protein
LRCLLLMAETNSMKLHWVTNDTPRKVYKQIYEEKSRIAMF